MKISPPLVGGVGEVDQPIMKSLIKTAKNLRKNSTDAEKKLWYNIRAGQFEFYFIIEIIGL